MREKVLVRYVPRAYGGRGTGGAWRVFRAGKPSCATVHWTVSLSVRPHPQELWVMMSCRHRFDCTKCPALAWAVSRGDKGVRASLSMQFCWELKTALKLSIKKKKIKRWDPSFKDPPLGSTGLLHLSQVLAKNNFKESCSFQRDFRISFNSLKSFLKYVHQE